MLIELLGEKASPTPDALSVLVQKYKSIGCEKVDSVCSTSLQKQFLAQVAELSYGKDALYQD